MDEERKVCDFCGEELAHSAYYRHLHDTAGSVCPGRSCLLDNVNSNGNDQCYDFDSSFELDSNSDEDLDLESNYSNCSLGSHLTWQSADSGDSEMEVSEKFSMSSASEEEIWSISSSDSEGEDQEEKDSSDITYGIYLFLNLIHLCHRLSDRAMTSLLKFMNILFSYIGTVCNNTLLKKIASNIPKTMYKIQKKFHMGDQITEYVVCPKCSSLYSLKDCVEIQSGSRRSKKCDYIEYPTHPHRSRRKKCDTVLLKSVKITKSSKLVPRKVYCYQSVIESLKKLVVRPGFLKLTEHWRESGRGQRDLLGDIYDGSMWKGCQTVDGQPFLSLPNNFLFGLNIDWFNPFSETPYSAGAIYLALFNLPRSERFKLENVILVGMIPGPKEPENVNPFLMPLVKDLNTLFDGVTFELHDERVVTVRALLACVMCDLPATRKVCGFSNFNATKGCSKCLKEFPTEYFGAKPDYSGFDCDEWEPRNICTHKEKAMEHKTASTASKQREIQQNYGLKYSEMLNLPFFNIIEHHIIDPMHNIFLGLAKHAFKTWKELELISTGDYEVLQAKVDSMNPPPKLGRIPRKIGSGFMSLTADEWKNWILIYSLYSLYGILPDQHYRCWGILVNACRLLLLPILTACQINRAHNLLVAYFEEFKSLYGSERCTPNMHMACHIKQCMLAYGPLSSFWCFAFERYNGTLEGVQKSWNGPEKQMMLKFVSMQNMSSCQSSQANSTSGDFSTMVCAQTYLFRQSEADYSSLGQSSAHDIITENQLMNYACIVSSLEAEEKAYQCLALPLKEKCFGDLELNCLQHMYELLYPHLTIKHVSRIYYRSKAVTINNEEFISTSARSCKSSTIAAHWPGVAGIDCRGEAPLRIGVVTQFLQHQVVVQEESESKTLSHILACVEWYMDHPRRDWLHSSMIISAAVFETNSRLYYMPISRIAARCASVKTTFEFDYGEDSIVLSVPLLKYV